MTPSLRSIFRLLRWPLAVLLCLGAGWAGNLALFHAWAGSGPPTPYPEWHAKWAGRFCGLTILQLGLLALLLGMEVWLWWKRRTSATPGS